MLIHPAAADEREGQQHEPERRRAGDGVCPDEPHVPAHHHRDGNGRRHRERSPGALPERVHDDERQHCDQDDHDQEDAEERGEAAERADLVLRHLAERPAVAPEAAAEDAEVLHRTAEHDAGEDPERPREVAELRGECRADQRTGAGDRGEVMAEDDPAVGRHEVASVVESLGRRRPVPVEGEEPRGEERPVEAVGERVHRGRGDDEPHGIHGLAVEHGEDGDRPCARERDAEPDEQAQEQHRQRIASSPVMSRPRISVCMSCVPS